MQQIGTTVPTPIECGVYFQLELWILTSTLITRTSFFNSMDICLILRMELVHTVANPNVFGWEIRIRGKGEGKEIKL